MPRDEQGNIVRETVTPEVSSETITSEMVTPPVVPVEPIPEVVPKPEVAKVEIPKFTTATVLSPNGQTIRVYTFERHGDKFQDCAKQMQEQNSGSTIVLT